MNEKETIRKDLEILLKKKKQQLVKFEQIDDWMSTTYIQETRNYFEFEKVIFDKYAKNDEKGRHVRAGDLPKGLMEQWINEHEKYKQLNSLYNKYSRNTMKRIEEKVRLGQEIAELNNIIYWNYERKNA